MPFEEIKRGDVIVFTYPNPEKDPSKNDMYYIKRVVGVPGDSIDINGRQLVINGRPVPLEYEGDYVDERSGEELDEYVEDLSGHKHDAYSGRVRRRPTRGASYLSARFPRGTYSSWATTGTTARTAGSGASCPSRT